jgi:hypothetical protein
VSSIGHICGEETIFVSHDGVNDLDQLRMDKARYRLSHTDLATVARLSRWRVQQIMSGTGRPTPHELTALRKAISALERATRERRTLVDKALQAPPGESADEASADASIDAATEANTDANGEDSAERHASAAAVPEIPRAEAWAAGIANAVASAVINNLPAPPPIHKEAPMMWLVTSERLVRLDQFCTVSIIEDETGAEPVWWIVATSAHGEAMHVKAYASFEDARRAVGAIATFLACHRTVVDLDRGLAIDR